MIEGVTSADQYIYHYTPFAKVILQNRTLKFGMYIKTNDPKESKDWQFDLGTNENADVGRYDMQALVACNIESDSKVCYQSACREQLFDCRSPKLRNFARECARGCFAPVTCGGRG